MYCSGGAVSHLHQVQQFLFPDAVVCRGNFGEESELDNRDDDNADNDDDDDYDDTNADGDVGNDGDGDGKGERICLKCKFAKRLFFAF